ncbi:MAG: hypothetical protein MUC59_07225 [Saprospiraceae bacterium]|nr:hypothetical protein [Saprospiraceae bacterium]
MKNRISISFAIFALLILSCSSKNEPTATGETAAQASAGSAKENHLSLKINGVEWVADHDVMALAPSILSTAIPTSAWRKWAIGTPKPLFVAA